MQMVHTHTHFCPRQLLDTQYLDTHWPTQYLHKQHFYARSSSTPLFHPQQFHARLYITHTTFTHLYTHSFHQQHFYTELFRTPHFDMHFCTPILHHLLSLSCLSHPIFTFLWLLVGRSWCGVIRSFNYDVLVLFDIQQQRLGEYSIQHRARMDPMKCWGRCFRCLAPVSLGVNPSINPTTSPWCKYPVRPECCLPDHTGPEKFQSMALIWRAANSSYKYIHTSCWCRSGRKIEQPWCSSLSYLSHLILFQM